MDKCRKLKTKLNLKMKSYSLTLWILTAIFLQPPLLSESQPLTGPVTFPKAPPLQPLAKKSDHLLSFSRFKSLDRVINRLDAGYQSSLKISGDGSSSYKTKFGDLVTSTIQAEGRRIPEVTEIEDDLEDEDEDSYEDDSEGEVLNDNTHNWNYSYKNGIQRPGGSMPTTTSTTTSTTTTTTPLPPPPPPPPQQLSYSQMKWRDLGTRQAVEQTRLRHSNGQSPHHSTRNQYGASHASYGNGPNTQVHGRSHAQAQTPDTSIREAINHALKVSREGNCKIPRARLVRVQDYYPHPGKTYVPHCTILHQCSDDTGCCRHDVLTCSPKTTQRVELYFYSILADNNRASSVERLVFYNHTECECRDKMEDLMPRDDVPAQGGNQLPPALGISNALNGIPNKISPGNTNTRIEKNLNALQCKCPSMFTERVLPDGGCACDCFDKQRECLLLKRGTDFFTMQDKWCIQSGRCEVPGCSFGSYIHLVGRCPRKKERSGQSLSWHRYLTQ